MLRFREIQIQEYRGVRELTINLGTHGIIATGTNGEGKSTIVSAVRTLAQGGDTGPDAVRNGAKQATLIALTENERIRQVITARTQSVAITPVEGGTAFKEPRKKLTASVGALLDPLKVISERKPEEVKKLVLETLDAKATLADLRAFAPSLPDGFDCGGHAMEARKRAEAYVYDMRRTANEQADQAEAAAARAKADAQTAEAGVPANAVPLVEAQAAREAARKVVATLDAQAAAAKQAEAKSAGLTARVAGLRSNAEALRAEGRREAVSREAYDDLARRADAAQADLDESSRRVEAAREALRAAEAVRQTDAAVAEDRRSELATLGARGRAADAKLAQADAADVQAKELEAALVDMGAVAPSQSDREAALFEAAKADAAVKAAELAGKAAEARRAATVAADAAKQRRARADALDAQVKALREKAPAALMGDHGIEGLDLSDDEVVLVGPAGPVKLSRCCGFERLSFAVSLAKRVNAESKLILVDGLEAVAEDQLDAFVDLCTEDGWTLVAAKVTAGPLHIVEIDKGPVSEQLEARRRELKAAAV